MLKLIISIAICLFGSIFGFIIGINIENDKFIQPTIEEKVELLEVQLSAMSWREDTIGIIENSEQLISEIDDLINNPNTNYKRKIELYKLRKDVQFCIDSRKIDNLILELNRNIYEES